MEQIFHAKRREFFPEVTDDIPALHVEKKEEKDKDDKEKKDKKRISLGLKMPKVRWKVSPIVSARASQSKHPRSALCPFVSVQK